MVRQSTLSQVHQVILVLLGNEDPTASRAVLESQVFQEFRDNKADRDQPVTRDHREISDHLDPEGSQDRRVIKALWDPLVQLEEQVLVEDQDHEDLLPIHQAQPDHRVRLVLQEDLVNQDLMESRDFLDRQVLQDFPDHWARLDQQGLWDPPEERVIRDSQDQSDL